MLKSTSILLLILMLLSLIPAGSVLAQEPDRELRKAHYLAQAQVNRPLVDAGFLELISLRNAVYDSVPIDVVTGRKKVIDVNKYYNAERLRPRFKAFGRQPLFIMTSDV